MRSTLLSVFFFFNDTATTEIYTLSLHDALPIFARTGDAESRVGGSFLGRHLHHGTELSLPGGLGNSSNATRTTRDAPQIDCFYILAVFVCNSHALPGAGHATTHTRCSSLDGDHVFEHRSVLIGDGKIARIGGPELNVTSAEVVDGRGRTLLPGLIEIGR